MMQGVAEMPNFWQEHFYDSKTAELPLKYNSYDTYL
jgi:hypothetical protein